MDSGRGGDNDCAADAETEEEYRAMEAGEVEEAFVEGEAGEEVEVADNRERTGRWWEGRGGFETPATEEEKGGGDDGERG